MLDMEACKRSRKVEDKKNAPLDPSIWGHLQDHIDLKVIYTKLPRLELLRLRSVCKAWNQAADRTLEPRPFFPIIVEGCLDNCNVTEYLNGLLSYDTISQSYSFKRQPFNIPKAFPCSPFAVEGLIFCHHPENLSEAGVFNIHSLTWHSIPDVSERRCAVGMLVDTSVRPHSFKLVVGSLEENTRIYDSTTRAWSVMSSRLQQVARYALNEDEIVNCMCVNNSVWISIGTVMLLVYSMERDAWTIMDTPEVEECSGEHGVHALGAWDGKIFTAWEDCGKGRVTVWELVDEAKAEWAEYIVISGSDYGILCECPFGSYGPSIYEEMRVLPCFCDGYLLLYNWHYSHCRSYGRGMLNLATCEWEKVTLPPRTVAFEEKVEDDMEGSDISEDDIFKEDIYEEDIFEEDSEEDRGYGSGDSGDSGHECTRRAIRIRRKQSRAKVNFRQSTGPHKTEARGVGHGCDIAPQAEKLPASMIGKMVVKRSSVLATIGAKAAAGAPSAWKLHKIAQPSPVHEKPVTFECAMCFFKCHVPDEYEAHKRTKTHGIIEQLLQQGYKPRMYPLTVLNNYASSNYLQAKYEYKNGECIATVGPRGSPGDSHVKGVARYGNHQKAKHMAAAAVLEKFLETYDHESKFAKYLHKLGLMNWNLGNRDPNDGGNKVAQPSPVYKKPVMFECAMCFFECDVPDEYEAHKRTKTHGIIEELQQQRNKHGVNPLIVLNNYVSCKHLQANYEYKNGEMIATVGPRGSRGDSHVKGVARHKKQQKAKQMAAAAVLEKVLEAYDPESKFAKYLHKCGLTNWNLGNRDPNDGGNKGGCSNEGNDGDSSIGVVGGKEGNIGGKVGSNSSQGVGATIGGYFGGNVDNVVGNPCGSGGSSGSGSEDGGVGKAGGSCEGVGNNLSNPNAIPVPGYNKYTSFAGSHGNIDVEKQDGTSQVAVPTSCPKFHNEKKLEKFTESGIQGGNGGVMPKPAPALRHNSHPGISAYGHQPRGPVMPHNGGRAQHMPNPIMVSRTHHYISTETFNTQQTAPWVGGPGQGGIPYPIYGMAPGVSPGAMVQPYTQQYAPPPINYGNYGSSQEFVVNAIQEMAPGTSTSAESTLVARYGMMQQPQQQVPQQHPGYALHPGDVPSFFASDHII